MLEIRKMTWNAIVGFKKLHQLGYLLEDPESVLYHHRTCGRCIEKIQKCIAILDFHMAMHIKLRKSKINVLI